MGTALVAVLVSVVPATGAVPTVAPPATVTHAVPPPPAFGPEPTASRSSIRAAASPLESGEFGYFEQSYHLANFDPLTSYLSNMNGNNTQMPTLASGPADPFGVYYVDNRSNLDVLSLNNSTVRTVAHIVPLYQRYGYPGMIDNEFFLEYGYDEALFFGTTSLTAATYSLELVNLTTGAWTMWNTSTALSGTNQEALYVGNNTVIVLSANDSIYGFNLAARSEWSAGKAGYFEANNIYWIPQLGQLINVEAGGSSADGVQQLNASYNAHGQVKFTVVANVAVDSGVRFNFVNGIGYNASLRELAFSAGYFRGDTVGTFVLQYLPTMLLSNTLAASYTVLPGDSPQLFTGQRYTFTSDLVLGGQVGGVQYLFNPWTGSTVPANRTFQRGIACSNACFETMYAPSSQYLLDYNASLHNESAFYDVVYAFHNWSEPEPQTYAVTFSAPTIAPSESWSVRVGDQTADGLGNATTVDLGNGSYPYRVTPPAGYSGTSLSGIISVTGAALSVAIPLTAENFSIEFEEKGLPRHTVWSVVLTGEQGSTLVNSSDGADLGFQAPDGVYHYSLRSIAGYEPRSGAYSGSVSVAGKSPPVVQTNWTRVKYSVRFSESGLPTGTNWSVEIDGESKLDSSRTHLFSLANGTYAFTVNATGYAATTSPAGELTVNGNAVTVTVEFAPTAGSRLPSSPPVSLAMPGRPSAV